MIRRVLFKIKLTYANDSDLSLLPVSSAFRLVHISGKQNTLLNYPAGKEFNEDQYFSAQGAD
jgi:hypothetical protein